MTALRLGTRASLLARTQAGDVADALTAAGVATELVPMTSHGDTTRASLASLGGTGVFAAALREALLAGECDAVVHSYKDLPTAPHPGLRVAATPARADHRDVLCAASPLAELREGARVGTGSPRRRAQLLAARPDLEVVDIRGNVDTRLAMVTDGELDGVVLAMAGLSRIGREEHVAETFEWPTAPAQGALAVEVRADDERTAELVAAVHDERTHLAVTIERAFLAELEAGCAAPVAATATVRFQRVSLRAVAYSLDGQRRHGSRVDDKLDDPAEIGVRAARALLDAGIRDWLA
ncbi:MAG TPA: hydroxymethylbilane synthase [Actinotalea caeni]|uniref:hydroxymethylbilane synthase n=1 Tax=Actinotalea caeni TaxID=1348467 RepID=UPI0012E24B90|nr:hydroxymethylbilane synthase [Actinotalea caeni]HLV55411.1 hydroxymethylbilane synthase [Actinotalea caeni]